MSTTPHADAVRAALRFNQGDAWRFFLPRALCVSHYLNSQREAHRIDIKAIRDAEEMLRFATTSTRNSMVENHAAKPVGLAL